MFKRRNVIAFTISILYNKLYIVTCNIFNARINKIPFLKDILRGNINSLSHRNIFIQVQVRKVCHIYVYISSNMFPRNKRAYHIMLNQEAEIGEERQNCQMCSCLKSFSSLVVKFIIAALNIWTSLPGLLNITMMG